MNSKGTRLAWTTGLCGGRHHRTRPSLDPSGSWQALGDLAEQRRNTEEAETRQALAHCGAMPTRGRQRRPKGYILCAPGPRSGLQCDSILQMWKRGTERVGNLPRGTQQVAGTLVSPGAPGRGRHREVCPMPPSPPPPNFPSELIFILLLFFKIQGQFPCRGTSNC